MTFEPFFILSVPIPAGGKKCDIQVSCVWMSSTNCEKESLTITPMFANSNVSTFIQLKRNFLVGIVSTARGKSELQRKLTYGDCPLI